MNKEKIIRREAEQLVEFKLSNNPSRPKEHKEFIDNLKIELSNLYTPENKVVFLDEVHIQLQRKYSDHKKVCTKGDDCFINKTFDTILFYVEQEIDELPKIVLKNKVAPTKQRNKVFISYSHKDSEWLESLKRHFKPFEGRIDFWDDTTIKAGQKWKEEIENAIKQTRVAILLVSADFFNSNFIRDNELPPLLGAAEKEGATILTVVLKPCMFNEYKEISQYQAINSPTNTIIQMDEAKRELTWVELVMQVKEIMEI